MLFETRDDGLIECVDWCDLEDDETVIGLIELSEEDNKYRFTVTASKPLSCKHLRLAAEKLGTLNAHRG